MEKKFENLPFILIILDGWGIAAPNPGNAVALADTPNFSNLVKNYPYTKLFAHGKYVGLPKEQSGNSEAGHMNIGAGRLVDQDAIKISKSIADGTFFKNAAFIEAIQHVKENKSRLHIMGMLSNGMSAHSDPEHMLALLALARKHEIKEVYLHLFTDGRDSPKYASEKLMKKLEACLQPNEKISTVIGRYLAMDRKKKWERTAFSYEALVLGKGISAESASAAVNQAYKQGESDEFISPYVIGNPNKGRIADNDAILFFNLRSDRARQLAKIFLQKDYNRMNPDSLKRPKVLKNLIFVAMTDFGPDLDNVLTAFPGIDLKETLPMQLKGLTQLYIAEKEKYAHVTYFFNGGYSGTVNGEDQFMIPSPDVKSYDEVPGMKSKELAEAVLKNLKNNKYDFTVLNFAAPDMIGHTGNLAAAIECCEIVDGCVGKIVEAYLRRNGTVMITADHGNVEKMINSETGEIFTEHTCNPVPFILVSENLKKIKLHNGALCDIAPTILKIIGLEKPKEMTGKSLI